MIISEKPFKITSPADVAHVVWSILEEEHETDQEKEHFWVLGLNTKNKVKYVELAALGILDTCLITPREVFRLAIMRACRSIIVCHNHPSGDTEPSFEDAKTTFELKAAGSIIGINVLDHIIIGNKPYFRSHQDHPFSFVP